MLVCINIAWTQPQDQPVKYWEPMPSHVVNRVSSLTGEPKPNVTHQDVQPDRSSRNVPNHVKAHVDQSMKKSHVLKNVFQVVLAQKVK